MVAERNLSKLLSGMDPIQNPGRYVFCTVRTSVVPSGLAPVATLVEPEGLSIVVTQDDADANGLTYQYVAAWITLRIHSALDAVGLTAAISTRLAENGISCNVVAGYYHDHLFVAIDDGHRAVELLRGLVSGRTHPPGTRSHQGHAQGFT
jgi:hypothetical protein